MEYISDQKSLEAFVDRSRNSSVLAIDTEFLREKTYYAKLCLLQLATDDEVVLVDPFSVSDLKVLAPLLLDTKIMKLLHAGSQDLEILLREIGVLPVPVFDTQIAAALLGYSMQTGYAVLVQSICGVSLKKADSFTDWSRRPLAESQLSYAADDVIYLPEIYRNMHRKLESKGRVTWLDNDFSDLSDPAKYYDDPRKRYIRLKRCSALSVRQLSAARELAAWRELEAQKKDVPRKWILTDEQIVEACKREARTIDDLFMVRGVRERLITRDAREVVSLICKGLDAPEQDLPKVEKSLRNEPNVDAEIDLMSAIVRVRAKENDIATQTLASHADLALVARGRIEDVEVMRGWRRAIVGDELLAFMEGRVSLSIVDGNVKITHL